jgi:prepilin-type N-terminal cleavage/methylation domain-containing protein
VKKSESGFTLIELLITISILAILCTALAAIFTTSLRASSEVDLRTGTSRDAEFLSTYFADDVSSASCSFTAPVTPGCTSWPGTLSLPVGATVVAEFTINDFVTPSYAASTPHCVLYYRQGSVLHRKADSPAASDKVVARDIRSAVFSSASWTLTVQPNRPDADNATYTLSGTRRVS